MAEVVPDAASPCWGSQHWPERAVRVNHLTCVDNGDGTVTATAEPYGGGQAVEKTVNVADHTTRREPNRRGDLVSVTPAGGSLRWRVIGDPEGEQVFTQKARADARAQAINEGRVAV